MRNVFVPRSFKRILTLTACILALTIPFQNCSKGPGESKPSEGIILKGGGNGDGYGGKVTYLNVATNEAACSDSGARSAIEVDANGNAALVRDNCQDITAQSVTINDLMQHNLAYLTFGGRLFQHFVSTEPVTGLFCRGNAVNPWGAHNIMDGMIQTEANQSLRATVKVGQYDSSGELIQAYEAVNVAVTEITLPGGGKNYSGKDANGVEVFKMILSKVNGRWQGQMNYIVKPGDKDAGKPPELVPVPGVICTEP